MSVRQITLLQRGKEMSRKHFRELAQALCAIASPQERQVVATLVANVCKQSNPAFDYQRFYAACGLQ